MRRVCMTAALGVVFALAAPPSPAHAYEFWLRGQTIGQSYQLRNYRLVGPDLFLGRRRYTQTLALRIWDIGDLSANRRRARMPDRGARVSWHSYLRIDHDFGDYASGRIVQGSARRDALDVIPELGESVASLDVVYGYVEVDGIADDRATVRVGRILADEGWGPTAIDGGSLRVELPQPAAVTVSAGLRVRASSPFGAAAYELDGTSGAACTEYVEAALPGTGAWKLVDRNRAIKNTKLGSDFEYCPQRLVRQPTVGATIATSRVRGFAAELGYRRTWSDTVGLIGPVDRLNFPDLGLYPNEVGQAPATGVNQEHLYARVSGDLTRRGVGIQPYAATRVSLLHAAVDRADAGVRFARGKHALEPALSYFLPTFDGDSIFNIFSIAPTADARLGYRYEGPVRASAGAWLRRYADTGDGSNLAGGIELGVERALGRRSRGRLDALWDAGYGGRRVGGTGEAAWQPSDTISLRGRVIVLGVAPDDLTRPRKYVTSSLVTSSTFRVADTVAIHAIAEADTDALHGFQTRVIAVLDLAFMPEP
ncbi:MAG: hypothetical protein KF773_16095 [Deltaproteobacteria bacterium]|nr:hypothetical protein [Deltaproteobacteria bacterium]MCW5805147.1 hypothetical protein [Deltaproteobacteria bacterium]